MTKTVFARIHLEATREERFPPGKLSELVKRFGLHTQAQEVFWVISNDRHGNVHTIAEVARGSHDRVNVDIPSVMTAVLATSAPAFSVAHNHPTMSVLPSQSDIALTHDLMDAANILGLLFEDHVIVDPTGDSFSFREAKMITGEKRSAPRKAASR